MHPNAIAQAKIRVDKAKAALAAMESAYEFAAFESAWTDFLLAANTVYTKLEEGSKDKGRGQAWFGRMQHERRLDELLNYIHHARNSDEHTIAPVTARDGGSISFKGDGLYNIRANGNKVSVVVKTDSGLPPTVEVEKPHVKLLRVQSLQKDWFDPPTMHKGQPLTRKEDERVLDVARKGLAYLQWLVAEGEKYAL